MLTEERKALLRAELIKSTRGGLSHCVTREEIDFCNSIKEEVCIEQAIRDIGPERRVFEHLCTQLATLTTILVSKGICTEPELAAVNDALAPIVKAEFDGQVCKVIGELREHEH